MRTKIQLHVKAIYYLAHAEFGAREMHSKVQRMSRTNWLSKIRCAVHETVWSGWGDDDASARRLRTGARVSAIESIDVCYYFRQSKVILHFVAMWTDIMNDICSHDEIRNVNWAERARTDGNCRKYIYRVNTAMNKEGNGNGILQIRHCSMTIVLRMAHGAWRLPMLRVSAGARTRSTLLHFRFCFACFYLLRPAPTQSRHFFFLSLFFLANELLHDSYTVDGRYLTLLNGRAFVHFFRTRFASLHVVLVVCVWQKKRTFRVDRRALAFFSLRFAAFIRMDTALIFSGHNSPCIHIPLILMVNDCRWGKMTKSADGDECRLAILRVSLYYFQFYLLAPLFIVVFILCYFSV